MEEKYTYKKRIKIPLFRDNLIIILTNDGGVIKQYCKKYKDRHAAITWIKDENVYIALDFSEEITFGIISHECFHSVNFILKKCNVDSCFDNDEPAAYLLDFIVDSVHKFIHSKSLEVQYAK